MNEGSDESEHMCSLTRDASSTHLQNVFDKGDQRWFRLVCAYVQTHPSFLCSSTKCLNEGSDESEHMCSLTSDASSTHLQNVRGKGGQR